VTAHWFLTFRPIVTVQSVKIYSRRIAVECLHCIQIEDNAGRSGIDDKRPSAAKLLIGFRTFEATDFDCPEACRLNHIIPLKYRIHVAFDADTVDATYG
jgi:hypothetical protein